MLSVAMSGMTRNQMALRAAIGAVQGLFRIIEDGRFQFADADPRALRDLTEVLTHFCGVPAEIIPCSVGSTEAPVAMPADTSGLLHVMGPAPTLDEVLKQEIPLDQDLTDFGGLRVPLRAHLLVPLQNVLFTAFRAGLWKRWSTMIERPGQPRKEVVMAGVEQLAKNLMYAAIRDDRKTIERLTGVARSFARYPILGQLHVDPESALHTGRPTWLVLAA